MARVRVVCFSLLTLLIVLAPLLRSGKPPLALLVLESIAVVLFLAVFWWPGVWATVPKLQRLLVAGLVAVPALYLVPLPGAVALYLPGRELYAATEALLLGAMPKGWLPLSAVPVASQGALLKVLLPVAVFLAASCLQARDLQRLVLLVLAMAGVQALIGLVQYGAGMQGPNLIASEHANAGNAAGTYSSRNNYAGLMYLALMPCMALYLATLGRLGTRASGVFRQRFLLWSSLRGQQAVVYGALALLLVLGAVFSRSRAGIGLTMLGIVVIVVLLSRRIGGETGISLLGRIFTVVGSIAVAIGLAPVWQRFSLQDPASDGRWVIFTGVFEAVTQAWPFGLGAGVFRETFFQWQSGLQASYTINQAHNSYLEWVYDAGLLAVLLIGLGIWIYLRRWATLWIAGDWGDFRYLQVGAGVGLGLMLLHELVDYNLFVPANMVMFALFAAVFLHEHAEPARRRQRGAAGQPSAEVATSRRERGPMVLPVGGPGAPNPFMD